MLKRRALVLVLLAVSAPASVLGTGAQPVRARRAWSPRRTSWPRRWGSRSCGRAATPSTPRWPRAFALRGHASGRRQHRRRRLPPLPARHRRSRGLRLPRDRPRGQLAHDVPHRGRLRQEEAPREPPVRGRAGDGGRPAHGLAGSRQAPLAAAARSRDNDGARGHRGDAGPLAFPAARPPRHEAVPGFDRGLLAQRRSLRGGRSLPAAGPRGRARAHRGTAGRPASTRARRPSSSKRR
jgi:hypothetical protein